MTNEMIIHLRPNEVTVETVREGRRSVKNTNIEALQEVLTRGEKMETPLLPAPFGVVKYTRVNNMEQYVIATPQQRYDAKFDMRGENGEGIVDYKIVAPASLWIIHVKHDPARDTRQYAHGVAYALKNPILGLSDQLYRFPFSNTNGDYLCWGSSRDNPELAGSKSVQSIPDRFFQNPFNSDLDGGKYRPIEATVNGRRIVRERCIHLLQHMDGKIKEAEEKGETYSFENDILRTSDFTLESAIRHWGRQYLR